MQLWTKMATLCNGHDCYERAKKGGFTQMKHHGLWGFHERFKVSTRSYLTTFTPLSAVDVAAAQRERTNMAKTERCQCAETQFASTE